MKRIALVLSVVLLSVVAKAQFPSRDSAHKFNNKYIRNIPVDAFHQLRLNTMVHYLINQLDSVEAGTTGSSDTVIVIQHGHNGNGKPGGFRYNDTLFVFQVSKDTVWVNVLLETANGLTKRLDTVIWGGTLDRETEIDQNGNGITFHDGIFQHNTGDYTGFSGAFSILNSNDQYLLSNLSNGSGVSTTISNTIAGGGSINLQTSGGSGGSSNTVLLSGDDGLTLTNTLGNVFMPNLSNATAAYQLYWNPDNGGKITFGLPSVGGGGGGGSGIVQAIAQNGLTNVNDSTMKLGGTLTETTTINTGGFATSWTGAVATGTTLSATNTQASGTVYGLQGIATASTAGIGVKGTGGNYGVSGVSTNGTGVSGVSTNGFGVVGTGLLGSSFEIYPSSTSTFVQMNRNIRGTTGTAANGIGGYNTFDIETTDGNIYTAARVGAVLTNATTGSRTGRFDVWTVDNATESRKFSVQGDGKISLTQYGVGTFEAAAAYILGVDASGEVVEVAAGDIGGGGSADNWGTDVVNHDATLTGNGTTGSTLKVDTSSGRIATKTDVASAAKTTVTAGAGISVSGSTSTGYTITATGGTGDNPFKALSIEDYGGVADAAVPVSGSSHTGTDNTPALEAAIADAEDGQWIVIPSGKWGFFTPVDTITGGSSSANKEVNILFVGDVFLNDNDFIRIKNQAGAYEQHHIVFQGNVWGRANQASHSYSTFIANTGPVWADYHNVVVKLINVNQSYIEFNKVTGTKSPIEIIGSGGVGSQENTVIGRWFPSNRYGIMLTSLDGNSYNDKNIFSGPAGNNLRIGGQIPLYIDGYSSAAAVNGETYNGAFRSNEFHFLIENAEQLPVCNGDITEPLFDITVEGGTTTGVLDAASYWQMKTSAPNYVRNPRYTGRGIYNANRLGTGSTATMGRNAVIDVPIWSSGSTSYYGKYAETDNSGNTLIVTTPQFTSQATRTGAPSFTKFTNETSRVRLTTTTAASSYTVASDDYVVLCNGAGTLVTVNLPSAASFPEREIFIRNISTTGGTVTVSGGDPSATDNIASGQGGIQYRSNGANWQVISKWHD